MFAFQVDSTKSVMTNEIKVVLKDVKAENQKKINLGADMTAQIKDMFGGKDIVTLDGFYRKKDLGGRDGTLSYEQGFKLSILKGKAEYELVQMPGNSSIRQIEPENADAQWQGLSITGFKIIKKDGKEGQGELEVRKDDKADGTSTVTVTLTAAFMQEEKSTFMVKD